MAVATRVRALHELRAPGPVESSVPIRFNARGKFDEFFSMWLQHEETEQYIRQFIESLRIPNANFVGTHQNVVPKLPQDSRTPPRRRNSGEPQSIAMPEPLKKASSRPLVSSTEKIPQFYFKSGVPKDAAVMDEEQAALTKCFGKKKELRLDDDFAKIVVVMGFSKYLTRTIFGRVSGGRLDQGISTKDFLRWWTKTLREKDDPERFFDMLRQPENNFIVSNDLRPVLEDIMHAHPGLEFLEHTPEFQARYVETVSARIFYTVNRSWTGRITLKELANSNLVAVFRQLDQQDDINKILNYFSYEHFYVLYCKFWEVDSDHDLLIDKSDLSNHDNHALTYRLMDRIFQQASRKFASGLPDKMNYEDFIFFFISEQDKRSETAIEYWFRCVDLDGDGRVSMYEMEYFFEEQLHRMECLNIETVAFEDMLCQMIDFIHPKNRNVITMKDIKRSQQGALFFNALFNLTKFCNLEQKDAASIRREREEAHLTDWDRYAREEYDRLAAEEEEEQHDVGHGAYESHESPF